MEKTNKSLTKHHLQNRPGKFLSIAFIYTSHTCGKNFFSEFPNFLPKMLIMKKKKNLPTISCLVGIAETLQSIVHIFREWLL